MVLAREPYTEKLTNIILKNKKYIYSVIFLINFYFINAFNDKSKDSLLTIVTSSTNDSSKSNAYRILAKIELLNNPNQSVIYVNKSIALYQTYSSNFPYLRYQVKQQAFRQLGLIDSSIYYCNLILKNALKDKSYDNVNFSYSEFGLISISQNNFSKAIEYFNKQLSVIKKNKLKIPFSEVYNNIGIVYGNKGDWDMAEEYFNRSIKDDIINNREKNLGNDYNNKGIVFLVKQKLDSAKKYFSISLNYRIKNNELLGIGGSLNNLALLENERNNYNAAIFYADSALKIAVKHGFKKLQVEIYDSYDQIFSKKGDYKKAYEYLSKKNAMNALFEKEEINTKIQQLESNFQIEQQQSKLLEKDLALTKSENQKQKQFSIIIIAILLIIALIFFLFNFLKNNKLLKSRNAIISEQKHLIEEKHKDITDSINYAQKIQSALIISEEKLNKNFKEAFVTFMPRDIVSGDFYWFSEYKNTKIIALADCTGHGVPGAFMSMIGITLLNQIVNEKGIVSPAQILNNLRKEIISALRLNSDGSDKRDGMDMAIISFNEKELCYAGANSQAIIIQNNQIIELKPDKQPIGIYEKLEDFNEQKIAITQNLKVYLFSDGMVDQFGGPSGKKIKTKQFKNWLLSCAELPLSEQKKQIETNLNNWKTGFEQTDDISLIGIRIS